MKFNTILKIVSALAAAIGTIYIVATYGDRIVAWAKGIMGCCSKSVMNAPVAPAEDFVPEEELKQEPAQETPAAEEPTAAEEAPAAQEAPATQEAPAAEEAAIDPVLSDDAIPVADEEDFEG